MIKMLESCCLELQPQVVFLASVPTSSIELLVPKYVVKDKRSRCFCSRRAEMADFDRFFPKVFPSSVAFESPGAGFSGSSGTPAMRGLKQAVSAHPHGTWRIPSVSIRGQYTQPPQLEGFGEGGRNASRPGLTLTRTCLDCEKKCPKYWSQACENPVLVSFATFE